MSDGKLIDIGDTRLHVAERGSGPAVIVLHGGPGLDHTSFGPYLDPLAERYRLLFVDQRGHGRSEPSEATTWTLKRLAEDVTDLARVLELGPFAVLGHSFGAFVALQHIADRPGLRVPTILCGGAPSTRYFESVDTALAEFEPAELREQAIAAMGRQLDELSPAEAHRTITDQLPFLFADPHNLKISEYQRATAEMVCAPSAMRHFIANDYGGIDVEQALGQISAPLLTITGRHDRICPIAAAESITTGAPHGELVVLEHSGHFPFVEENEAFLAEVTRFLAKHLG